ncbi:hypothetical protein GCM10017673_34040 [Streptosporangium violaceochromogenes]|nr:hypothetical protein GCM10017673_34040 [Streptosporangium violaceochromogenes]
MNACPPWCRLTHAPGTPTGHRRDLCALGVAASLLQGDDGEPPLVRLFYPGADSRPRTLDVTPQMAADLADIVAALDFRDLADFAAALTSAYRMTGGEA